MKINKYSLLYYIDMSIINYRNRMLYPLWELEINKKINNYNIYNNKIQNRYWYYMKLYRKVLLYH